VNGEQPSLSAKDVVGESFLSAPKFA
jgi:hypothetical protein